MRVVISFQRARQKCLNSNFNSGLKAVVNDGRLTGWPVQPFSDPVRALVGTNAGACTYLLEPLVYLTALIDLFACIKIDWH